jgi:phage tail-like protein
VRRGDWLIGQLPMGMLDDDFFTRFVRIFQDVATTFLDDVDNLDNIVDVRVAPEPLVPWLGSWIATPALDSAVDDGAAQRRIVHGYAALLAWRGTYRGLAAFLELFSGAPAEIEESGGTSATTVARAAGHTEVSLDADELVSSGPWVRVRVASTGNLAEPDFVRLVADEVPADVALTVFVGPDFENARQVWPRPAQQVSAS